MPLPGHRQDNGLNLTLGCAVFQLLIDGISENEIWAESVESSIPGDYYRMTTIQLIRGRLEGVREVNMHPAEQFVKHIPWSEVEKKTARRAFDKALEMQCTAITAEAKRMLASATTPFDVWRVHDYLS